MLSFTGPANDQFTNNCTVSNPLSTQVPHFANVHKLPEQSVKVPDSDSNNLYFNYTYDGTPSYTTLQNVTEPLKGDNKYPAKCTLSGNVKDSTNSIPSNSFHPNTLSSEILEECESTEEPFGDNSDLDPNYTPSEISDPEDTLNNLNENFRAKSKRRITAKEKIGRKKSRNESEWIDVKSKSLLNTGKEHENRKGKSRKERKLGVTCNENCRLKCSKRVGKEARQLIFEEFWRLGDHTRQWDFIIHCVKQSDKRQVTVNPGTESRRKFTRNYYFKIQHEEIKVCKSMFLNTLNISETWVTTALAKMQYSGTVNSDERGKHKNRPATIKKEIKDTVRNHIKMFPTVPSHYTRKDSQKTYLEEGLSIQKMFRLYTDFCNENKIIEKATQRQYRDIFNQEFNIGFFKPKKDQCEICSVYDIGNTEKKNEMQERYENHLKNKIKARELKDSDKDAARDDKSLCVACFDLQKVLATPQSNVSDFYYKSKYSTYNFTVYDIGNNEGYCYVWHEQIAKRGPNEIASCLWKFLELQKSKNIRKIVFYSDNCGGQNRNRFIFAMLSLASLTFELDIIHRFLEKGHTQNEGDSMHGVIENAKKRQSVLYVPEQWVTLIRMAKTTGKVYNVTEMSQSDFFNFKNITAFQNWKTDREKKKFNISKVKEISFKFSEPNRGFFKYEYDASENKAIDIKEPKLEKRKGRPEKNIKENIGLQQLYVHPLPIDAKKLKGLLWLCDTGKIPPMYHNFYKNLTSKKESPMNESDSDDNENLSN